MMTSEEESEILSLLRESRIKARGYADFFGWGADRDLEEWGVVTALAESLRLEGKVVFSSLKSRGRGNDPPDCEALDNKGKRIAIEVTELVDGEAIKAYKSGAKYIWADWNKSKFIGSLESLITRKDSKFIELKEPPYGGGYFIVIFTDEDMLDPATVELYLQGYKFNKPKHSERVFLLLSYDPTIQRCPYYELQLSS